MKSSILMAVVCALSVSAFSGCRFSPSEKAEKVASHVSRKLDLNDSQKAEFQKLTALAVEDFKSTHADRKALANEVEKQIVSQIGSEKVDTTEIKRIAAEQNVKRQAMTLKWIDRMAAFQATLSPEQKQKALKAIQDVRGKMESRFED